MQEYDKVTIKVPCSSANVGPFYDVGCLGLEEPSLLVSYETRQTPGLSIAVKSPLVPPTGRILGTAGKLALEHLINERGLETGARLTFEDKGFPIGGLGRSGAEAVGAIIAACVYHGISLSRDEIVKYSAKGEPGEHKDNVAGSTNGRFNIIAISPFTELAVVQVINTPPDLGIAIGFSSHQKTTGTEGMRQVLQAPIPSELLVKQSGRVAMVTAAMVSGDTNLLLEFIGGDLFHEPRRAEIKGYGDFNAAQFSYLKKLLYQVGVVINVSGAGPNMQFLYNKKQYPDGIVNHLSKIAVPWFKEYNVLMEIKEMKIAQGGAYDYAAHEYSYH